MTAARGERPPAPAHPAPAHPAPAHPAPAHPLPDRLRRAVCGVGAVLAVAACAPPAAGPPPVPASDVRDGTWTGTGTYESPGGPQELDVRATFRQGTVVRVDVLPAATNATSRRFQERFADAVAGEVVGLPVDEVHVDRLAGSSGTGAGFMQAVTQAALAAAGR